MAKTIKIKKGLSINLKGEAPHTVLPAAKGSNVYALVPDFYTGVVPKPAVKVGDSVAKGDAVFYDKRYPEMKFVAPVAGTIKAINRGAKRHILNIEIASEASEQNEREFAPLDVDKASADEIKARLLESGLWGFIKQRPYDIVAHPDIVPRDIFVTAFFTAPLAPDFAYVVEGRQAHLELALKALRKLTPGKLYISAANALNLNMEGVEEYVIEGPHPAGSVGVLINKTKPINKGETVWTLKATDLLVIGRFLATGKVDFSRQVAVTGSEATEKGYMQVQPGCAVTDLVGNKPMAKEAHLRVIAGDVLTGQKLSSESLYTPMDLDQITIIPEGDNVHEAFGWIAPRFNQFSMNHSYFSWLMPQKKYAPDARIKGGERAMIMSNEYVRVFPLDIFAEQLLKAIIAFDIDKMEALGIYEVAPEDFALCEFVDSSKKPLQYIVRQGLDLLYKEMN